MLSMISLPMPGHEKIVSVTTEKAMTEPNSSPTIVTTGMSVFFRTWVRITEPSDRPLARAVRT